MTLLHSIRHAPKDTENSGASHQHTRIQNTKQEMASNQATSKLVNESIVEFLTTEMVEAMVRTIKDDAKVAAERDPNGNLNDGAGGPKDYSEGDEAMEAVYFKLEMIGFRVGERLIEKYVKRLILCLIQIMDKVKL